MKKKLTATMLLTLIFISSFGVKSFAAYQIRPNYSALRNTPATDFFHDIRVMETKDGPMGLDMPNEENNIYQGYGSNNIDVHMIKNTEWGAVAMLSMSGYGAGDEKAQYSTGNLTGVNNLGYDANWEYTASLVSKDGTTIDESNANAKLLKDKKIDKRYYDLYYVNSNISNSTQQEQFYKYNYKAADSSATIDHHGDAYYEVKDIFTGTGKYNTCPAGPFFGRGGSGYGGVFASNYYGGYASTGSGTRAVVVCGAGL